MYDSNSLISWLAVDYNNLLENDSNNSLYCYYWSFNNLLFRNKNLGETKMPKIEDLYEQVKKPGIYFNLSNEDYHNDLSLSNSGMGNLAHTPKFGPTISTPKKYWWNSPFNPDREPLDTQALKTGRALHTFLLEPEQFHKEFKIKEGVQNTKAKGMIGEGAFKDIQNATAALRQEKQIYPLFKNGYPEVSIFWIDEETGVPCRARMDYLNPLFATDYKTTANIYDLGYSIIDYGYTRQSAFYLRGIEAIKKLMREDKLNYIYGEVSDEFLNNFMQTTHDKFFFVFQEKTAPYVARAETLCSDTQSIGLERAKHAMQIYKENYELQGSESWASGFEYGVSTITKDDLPTKLQY